jgi:hypothetical protein
MTCTSRGAQLGGDLARSRPRVLRRYADEDVDLSARVHADGCAFVRPEAGALGVAGDADAEAARAVPVLLLAPAPSVVAQDRQRAVERAGKVGGIVRDRRAVLVDEAGLVRHLVRADEVVVAQFDRVDAEAARADVHQALHDEVGLGPARAAVGAVERLVGDHALALAAEVRHAVGRAEVVDRVQRESLALDGVGADVGQE